MKQAFVVFSLLFLASAALACEEYDYKAGSYMEVETSSLFRSGRKLENSSHGSSEYQYGDARTHEYRVEVEVYDPDTGQYQTFDMKR